MNTVSAKSPESVHIQPEWPFTFDQNQRSRRTGIGGLEYALDAQACDSIARLHIFYLEGYALPALDELIASGQFGLIRDQVLLKALSDYLSFARAMPSRADAVIARAPILRQEFPSAITTRAAITNGVRTVTNECDLAACNLTPPFLTPSPR